MDARKGIGGAAAGLNWDAPLSNDSERSQLGGVINFGRPSIKYTTGADKSVALFRDSNMLFPGKGIFRDLFWWEGRLQESLRVNELCAGSVCLSFPRP